MGCTWTLPLKGLIRLVYGNIPIHCTALVLGKQWDIYIIVSLSSAYTHTHIHAQTHTQYTQIHTHSQYTHTHSHTIIHGIAAVLPCHTVLSGSCSCSFKTTKLTVVRNEYWYIKIIIMGYSFDRLGNR